MVYIISDGTFTKIGWSKDPQKRLRQLQTGNSLRLKLLKIYEVPRIKERYLHKALFRYKVRHNGEWFNIPSAEAINVVDSLLNHALV
jgi:hypothetical protein